MKKKRPVSSYGKYNYKNRENTTRMNATSVTTTTPRLFSYLQNLADLTSLILSEAFTFLAVTNLVKEFNK